MTSDQGTSVDADLQLDTPVATKTHGLNPNATEFLSHQISALDTVAIGASDRWHNNIIQNNMTSVSKFAFNVNGDVHWDNPEVIYSPGLESTSQTFVPPFPEEQPCVVNDTNLIEKREELLVHDNVSAGYHMAATSDNYSAEVTGIQYNNGNDGTEAEMQLTGGNLSEDQLRHTLKNLLESLFSRENLSNDSYLQSQMDSDQYVLVTTVANLDQIRTLTNDLNLIVELFRESSCVQVDEKGQKVRPNHNRCIVILREIPGSTPIEEVQNLFSGENCPNLVSCEFAHNNNWYVMFASDLDAQQAYQYLREVVKTFQGKPIMARIKANSLIPTYHPRIGSITPFQPPQVMPPQMLTEIGVSTHQPQQFTANQPFSLINQYGQQAIPFYPPPISHMLPSWHGHMMDPSMVLAMNGYHATNVKVNSNMTDNRGHPFNANRVNHRNQKFHWGSPIGRDRINSNESLPPRLQHQHERQQHMNSVHSNSVHKPNAHISNLGAQYYHSRCGEMNSGGSGIGGHATNNHTGYVSQNHYGSPHLGSTGSHQPYSYHQQQFDSNNNSNQSRSATTNGASVNSGTQALPSGSDTSQRFAAGKSYKGRRRREEDGARQNRSASQPSQRDGTLAHLDHSMSVEKFDYEPTSFPPLPGAETNKSSNEVFESKLSDVVKGKVKQQIKETPAKLVASQSVVSSFSSSVTATTQTIAVTDTSKASLSESKDVVASVGCSTSQQTICVPSATLTSSKQFDGVTEPPQASFTVRNEKQVQTVPETQPNIDRPQQQQQQQQISVESLTNCDGNAALLATSLNKPSYAEMVQRAKVIEVSANSVIDLADSEHAITSTQPSSRALKEQGQQQNPSKPNRSSVKEDVQRNGRNLYDSRFDRERNNDLTKESDHRRTEKRGNKRSKENRERRFGDRKGIDERRDSKETQRGFDESKRALEKGN